MINLLPRRDKYVLWYFDPGNVREVSLFVDRDGVITVGREVALKKENFSSRFFIRSKTTPTIIALHPSYSWSAMVSLEPITDAVNASLSSEYQESVGHLLERSTREYRSRAAQQLGVYELDAVVVDAYIGQFQLDNSSAVSRERISRSVKKKSVRREDGAGRMLCITFTTRDILDALASVLQSREEVFFTDAWRAEAIVAKKALGSLSHYVVLDEGGSYCYALADRGIEWCVREGFPWRTKEPITFLARAWDIPVSVSQALFQRYHKQLVPSANVHTFFSSTFSPAKRSFFDAVFTLRLHGTVFVRGSGNLPMTIPARHRTTRFHALPVQEIFQKLGVVLRESKEQCSDSEALFARVAPFLEYDRFGRSADSLHEFLRRRIHWIFSV